MSRVPGRQINLVGTTLGPYQVLEEIGRGGMGIVYRGLDPTLGRHVALKVLPALLASDKLLIERFRQEARTAAQLEHPRLVTIYQVGEDQDLHYIAMQFIQGKNLEQVIREAGKLDVPRALEIARQTAQALSAAHDAGVIHRDIKPQNIMIDHEGRVKVMDFGIARLMAETSMRLTQAGTVVGTPAYMPPEQGGGGVCDARADVYSLGVVLFEMLTGRPPYEALTPMLLFQKIVSEAPTIPDTAAELPPGLMDYVLYMIAKEPRDRPGSMEQVARELGGMINLLRASEAVTGKMTAPMPPLWTPPPELANTPDPDLSPPNSRRKVLITAGVLALLAALGFAAMRMARGSSKPTVADAAPAVPVVASPPESPTPAPTPPPATPTPLDSAAAVTEPVGVPPIKITGVEFDREFITEGVRFSFKIKTDPADGSGIAKYRYKLDGQPSESESSGPVVMLENIRAGDRALTVTLLKTDGTESEPFPVAFTVRRAGPRAAVRNARENRQSVAKESSTTPAAATPPAKTEPPATKEPAPRGGIDRYFKPTGKPGMLKRIRGENK